jgi:TolB-like protein/Flp pilus assembly protein TadD
LKQRKIVQWALAYAAAAWIGLEVFDLVAEQFMWPIWVRQSATVLLLFGLLITLILAWHHGERGRQKVGPGELASLVVLLVLAGGSVWVLRSRDAASPVSQSSIAGFSFRQEPLPENSVAVLPCLDLSGEASHEHFADGLAAELITRLAAVSELRVPSHTSSFAFKGRSAPIEEVASSLRVRHVLECSVTGDGSQLRISTRLVDAESGYTLWSEAYDREAADLFDVQRDIAQAVVGSLEVELRGEESMQLAQRWTDNEEAYDHFLRGIQLQLRAPTAEAVERGRRHLEQAIDLDPTFGRAYARLAMQWILVGNWLLAPPGDAYTEAERLAGEALELDSELFEAYWARGWARMHLDAAWLEAREDFRRTISLAPNEWAGYHSLGFVEGVLGRTDQALAAARVAFDLDPLAYWPQIGLSFAYTRRRDYESAVRTLQSIVEVHPDEPYTYAGLALSMVRAGLATDAEEFLLAAMRLAPEVPPVQLSVALVRAAAGDRKAVRAIVEPLEEAAANGPTYATAGLFASVYGELGDKDRAMRWLNEARENLDTVLLFLDSEEFDSLRGDPRFAEFIRDLELPEDIYLRPAGSG